MEIVFISKLKPFFDAVAKEMELYISRESDGHYVYHRYDPAADTPVRFSAIRACTPAKEFLFPMREMAASMEKDFEPKDVKPFAVFGLKDCDIRSIEILDKVFAEDEFEDSFYTARRKAMFIISSDCTEPGETCFCNLFGSEAFPSEGFDLNVSPIKDGFIIDTGSQRGQDFIKRHSELFGDVPDTLLAERNKNREETKQKLEESNRDLEFEASLRDVVENSQDSDVYDEQAAGCIECQACTRVCPTCHCFYLYDAKQKDYFSKMKIWDSCMRYSYAAVAGGANPYKVLGDRLKHRFLHKFVYFLERYGIDMCVGCGRCIDADAGGIDLREVLKRLSKEIKQKT